MGVQINDQMILNSVDAIIDTGTHLVIGDPTQVKQLYGGLGGTLVANDHDMDIYACKLGPSCVSWLR